MTMATIRPDYSGDGKIKATTVWPPSGFGSLNQQLNHRAEIRVDMASVLRPFESKLFRTTAGRPVREEAEDDVAVFEITASARVEVTTVEGLGWTWKWDDDDTPDKEDDEVTRVTRTKRIFNPEDSEQYVDVEVIDAIEFLDKSNRKTRLRLNNN